MDYKQLLDSITPEIYENLKRSIELGKFPDGRVLTREQRESCMQGVIAYEHKYLGERERTGFVPPKNDSSCDTTDMQEAADAEKPLNWA